MQAVTVPGFKYEHKQPNAKCMAQHFVVFYLFPTLKWWAYDGPRIAWE